ncbi:MAG: hypothetical protein M9910_11025 [Kiritimatiellae bacterium]|nr:hypothetical protein [Kiritimatiellia bacterium]
MAVFSIVPFDELTSTERWDAEFYQPHLLALADRLKRNKAAPLAKYVEKAQRGQAPAYNDKGTVPVIRTVNVRDLEISDERLTHVTKTFFNDNPKGHVEGGNIVVTSTGMGTLGRAFCNLYDRSYFADGHISILQLRDRAKGPFLAAVLQSSIGIQQFEQRQRGSSGQIEIYPEDILSVLIPRLPPETIKSIAEVWTDAVQLVEDSKRLYPEAEAELLDRIGWAELATKSAELFYVGDYEVLAEHQRFDAEHYQPKYARISERLKKMGAFRLSELIDSCDKGTQPAEYTDNGEVIVVKSKNVFGQGIDLVSCERTTLSAWADKPARLNENDVVINSTGMGTLGRAGVIHCDGQKIVASVDLLILRVRPGVIDPDYLSLFLNSPAGIAQSEQFQTGSSGQLHLYPEHVRQFMIYVPKNSNGRVDIAWQERLANKVRQAALAKVAARVKLEEAKRLVEEALTEG